MIRLYILCKNDFPERAFLSKKAAERERAKGIKEADEWALKNPYGIRNQWHISLVFYGPPICLPRRSGGGYWEAQIGRLHFLFNHCGYPIKVRITNKGYGYD